MAKPVNSVPKTLLLLSPIVVLPIAFVVILSLWHAHEADQESFALPDRSGQLIRADPSVTEESGVNLRPIFGSVLSRRLDTVESAAYEIDGQPIVYLVGGEGYSTSPKRVMENVLLDLPTKQTSSWHHHYDFDGGIMRCVILDVDGKSHFLCGWVTAGTMGFAVSLIENDVAEPARSRFEPLAKAAAQMHADSQ